ncbi:MAG: hypothetical protein WAW37_15620 [Syntrophobacteraceae bacterium]
MKKTILAITMAVLMAAGGIELAAAAGGPGKGKGGDGRNWSCPAAARTDAKSYRQRWQGRQGQGRSDYRPDCPYRPR